MSNDVAVLVAPPKASLVTRIAERYGVEPGKMMDTLKATAFKTEKPVTNEQMMALLIVAEQYRLNPFTRELFAFPDKSGGIVPVVSVDGWVRIVNERTELDGWSVGVSPDGSEATCTMWRKDRTYPTVITEYLAECRRNTDPWNKAPKRMLRHKAFIQTARMAFGFAGIYDEDEARRIVEAAPTVEAPAAPATLRLREALAKVEIPPPLPVLVDEAPPVPRKTLAMYTLELISITDAERAAVLVDEARSVLPPEHYVQLCSAYTEKFPVDPPEEPMP